MVINMKKSFIPAMLILTAIFTFCTVQVVQSHEKGGQQIEEKYYDVWEAAYLQETKQLLEQYGLKDSGINMTKVKEADGSRSYEIAIHHRRFEALSDRQHDNLMEELYALPFPIQRCGFRHYFIL